MEKLEDVCALEYMRANCLLTVFCCKFGSFDKWAVGCIVF